MKKACFLLLIILWDCTTAYSQTIQYSRQTFEAPYAYAMQLVADIEGYHHVLCFSADKAPVIYIFDAQLQLQGKEELPFKLKETPDIRVITFAAYYLLYIHSPGTTVHHLWKINGKGSAAVISSRFQNMVDSVLNRNNSTLQLVNRQEALYAIAHTYFDAIKKMSSTVVAFDENLNFVQSRNIFYPFNKEEESLQQSLLAGNNLLLLKTSRNEETGNALDVVKLDLDSTILISKSFRSGSQFYTAPSLVFNERDSSILVYATIRSAVFINRLNLMLQEQAPIALLRTQFKDNTAASYLLTEGPSPMWIGRANYMQLPWQSVVNRTSRNFFQDDSPMGGLWGTRPYFSTISTYIQPTAVRFTVLNESLQPVADSLVQNKKNVVDVQPLPSAQFVMNNKAYLVLIQNFTSKHRGLLMVNRTGDAQLATTEIRVYDRYNYLLTQLRAVGNSYFILPYAHKNDIGLVKIKLE